MVTWKRMDTQMWYPVGVVIWYYKNHLYKCFQVYFLRKVQNENKNMLHETVLLSESATHCHSVRPKFVKRFGINAMR